MTTPEQHIEIYKAPDGWRWRAVAGNGETVASGEAHTRRWSAKSAARRVFPDWPIKGFAAKKRGW